MLLLCQKFAISVDVRGGKVDRASDTDAEVREFAPGMMPDGYEILQYQKAQKSSYPGQGVLMLDSNRIEWTYCGITTTYVHTAHSSDSSRFSLPPS
jgi:hypothetical protein